MTLTQRDLARIREVVCSEPRRTGLSQEPGPKPEQPDYWLHGESRLSGSAMGTIAAWVWRGLLPGRKVNGRVVINRPDLERFLEEQRVRFALACDGILLSQVLRAHLQVVFSCHLTAQLTAGKPIPGAVTAIARASFTSSFGGDAVVSTSTTRL